MPTRCECSVRFWTRHLRGSAAKLPRSARVAFCQPNRQPTNVPNSSADAITSTPSTAKIRSVFLDTCFGRASAPFNLEGGLATNSATLPVKGSEPLGATVVVDSQLSLSAPDNSIRQGLQSIQVTLAKSVGSSRKNLKDPEQFVTLDEGQNHNRPDSQSSTGLRVNA